MIMQCSTLSLIWKNLAGHSLLPYQQIPEPNMPHNVSFNQQGYPGPHSPYQQQAPTSPHSPSLPSPPPPMHLRHDLPPGSPHYSIGSNGLSSSPPQGPHSPHSLSPDTPPPAYSPRLDLSGRRRSFDPLLVKNCQYFNCSPPGTSTPTDPHRNPALAWRPTTTAVLRLFHIRCLSLEGLKYPSLVLLIDTIVVLMQNFTPGTSVLVIHCLL